jgi:hypothetical protein
MTSRSQVSSAKATRRVRDLLRLLIRPLAAGCDAGEAPVHRGEFSSVSRHLGMKCPRGQSIEQLCAVTAPLTCDSAIKLSRYGATIARAFE